jgi:hypothetical protein
VAKTMFSKASQSIASLVTIPSHSASFLSNRTQAQMQGPWLFRRCGARHRFFWPMVRPTSQKFTKAATKRLVVL